MPQYLTHHHPGRGPWPRLPARGAGNRLRLSPLVGYLLAGVMIGPATPGFIADTHLAPQLAGSGLSC